MKELTKMVPARRVTLKLLWVRRNFMVMGDGYRKARARSKRPMDSCFWCRRKFADGEAFDLACVEGRGNRVFCQDCTKEVEVPHD